MHTRPTFLLLAASLTLIGCGTGSPSEPSEDAPRRSESGLFVASFQPDPDPPITGKNALGIELTTADQRALVGAQISVVPSMPAHGHGSPETPEVDDQGGGSYRVGNIVYTMPGDWQLDIHVESGPSSDRFVLLYAVE